MINVKCLQLGFYLSGIQFLFPMGVCSQNCIIYLQNSSVRFRKQLVSQSDPVGILLTGILDMHMFRTKNSLYNLFSLDFTEKCLGNSDCKSWCTALVALLGKKQK